MPPIRLHPRARTPILPEATIEFRVRLLARIQSPVSGGSTAATSWCCHHAVSVSIETNLQPNTLLHRTEAVLPFHRPAMVHIYIYMCVCVSVYDDDTHAHSSSFLATVQCTEQPQLVELGELSRMLGVHGAGERHPKCLCMSACHVVEVLAASCQVACMRAVPMHKSAPLEPCAAQDESICHAHMTDKTAWHSLSLSLSRSLALSLSRSLALSLSRSLALSLSRSLALSLSRSLALSLALSLSLSLYISIYLSISLSLSLPRFALPFSPFLSLLRNRLAPSAPPPVPMFLNTRHEDTVSKTFLAYTDCNNAAMH